MAPASFPRRAPDLHLPPETEKARLRKETGFLPDQLSPGLGPVSRLLNQGLTPVIGFHIDVNEFFLDGLGNNFLPVNIRQVNEFG